MIYIINYDIDKYGRYYSNYYINNDDINNIIYYDRYLNVIDPKNYGNFNIKPMKHIAGAGQYGGIGRKVDPLAAKYPLPSMPVLFSGEQATKWTTIATMLRDLSIPLIGKNLITKLPNSARKSELWKKEKNKDGEDVDVFVGDAYSKILFNLLTMPDMIIKYTYKDTQIGKYYSFSKINKPALTEFIRYIIHKSGNESQKAFVAENKAVKCLNFFCCRFAKFDKGVKQRQECNSCDAYRLDPTKSVPSGWQIEYEQGKKGDIEINYVIAIRQDVVCCYTSMCHNNFNPSYWIKKDGSKLDVKINGKTINEVNELYKGDETINIEGKTVDELNKLYNEGWKKYIFSYSKPIFEERKITGKVPKTKTKAKKDDDDDGDKGEDEKEEKKDYIRDEYGNLIFIEATEKQKEWKKVLKGRLPLQEIIIDGKPYRCELSRSYKSYGNGIIELDHKDGEHHNNVITNIDPLCKICHGIKTDQQKDKAAGAGENYANIKFFAINLEGDPKVKEEYLFKLICGKLKAMDNAFYKYDLDKNELINQREYVFKQWGYLLSKIDKLFIKDDELIKKGTEYVNKYDAEQAQILSEAKYITRPLTIKQKGSQNDIIVDKSQDEQKAVIDIINVGKAEAAEEV